jgi:hypothetical protein
MDLMIKIALLKKTDAGTEMVYYDKSLNCIRQLLKSSSLM